MCDIDCAIFIAVNVHFEIMWSKRSYFICRGLLGPQSIQLRRRRTVHTACGALRPVAAIEYDADKIKSF